MATVTDVSASCFELKLQSCFSHIKSSYLNQTDIVKTNIIKPERAAEFSTLLLPIAIPLLLPSSTCDVIQI
jgi:hypothetical protein